MFSEKSTIYQSGWLDLIFANRNKSYGAYELRQNYNKRLGRALLFSSAFIIVIVSAPLIKSRLFPVIEPVHKSLPPIEPKIIEVDLTRPLEKIEKPAAAEVKAEPVKASTLRYVKPVAVKGDAVEEPPSMSEIETAIIGTQTIEGPAASAAENVLISGNGSGQGTAPGGEDTADGLTSLTLLEKYPEFPGGMEAFARYLQKNLRYPAQAADVGVGGRVFVSFIVEKDGRLTDIKVLKGIGYGCDEEATRVLKKSPRWNPGVQNKQQVRVLYTIPLVFQLGE